MEKKRGEPRCWREGVNAVSLKVQKEVGWGEGAK